MKIDIYFIIIININNNDSLWEKKKKVIVIMLIHIQVQFNIYTMLIFMSVHYNQKVMDFQY